MLQTKMKCRHVALAAILLATGSYNTLSIKWANTLSSEATDGIVRRFNHPFVQGTAYKGRP